MKDGFVKVPLGELIDKIEGGATPSKDIDDYWDGDVPWATVKDLKGTIINDTIDYISQKGLENSSTKLIPAWTLVVSTRMALGKAVFFKKDVAINQDLKALYLNGKLDKFFLFHWFYANAEIILGMGSGSTVKGIRLEVLKALKIPLPPLPEQQKIAKILSTVDDKIDVIDQQINETQELKKGLMQRLLTKGIGHTEFKDSPLGEIPESWEVLKFSELVSNGVITKIQDGNHGESHPVSDDFVEEGIPFITANCISISNKLDLNKAKRISFNQYKSLRIGFSEPNDILLTHKGTVGLTAIVEQKHGSLMLTPQVTYYRIGDETVLNRRYLYYYFQSSIFQNLIDKFSKQSTRAYIGIANQKNLLITLPKDSFEQQKIASILSSVDEKLEVLEDKKTHYQELKQGLMQQLLTGKIRVTV
ncbi:restriction endonuclease subunit S [uncultured Draconibacterium sp.]|uniref:restriction endonuclease subunit S n=1 Tax=uncultured Draconibacterium sp. TaxID=1573823 RepID=UPI0029C76962|nr:restriction endonuclease subunit S [uncultured Draconibacterium sp.]